MSSPIIAITTWRKLDAQNYPSFHLAEAYIQALSQAGASPLLIPLGLTEDNLENLLYYFDGFIFSGGGDISAGVYDFANYSELQEVDPGRDQLELYLFHRVKEQNKPFLGVCRGMQLINIALGGTLYADIATSCPGALKHDYLEQYPRDFKAHEIRVTPNSLLDSTLEKPSLEVNSIHHQGVDKLAPDLVASAHSNDGLVEAVELPNYPFGLGVQWHPECLLEMPEMKKLFGSFVSAAAGDYS